MEHSGVPDEVLFTRLQELQELNKPWQGVERAEQINREIGYLSFEMSCRYAEAKGIDSDKAWVEEREFSNHG